MKSPESDNQHLELNLVTNQLPQYVLTSKILMRCNVVCIIDPVPPRPPPPPSHSRWSLSASWDGVPDSWGGYNNSIPLPGDDVIILPGR